MPESSESRSTYEVTLVWSGRDRTETLAVERGVTVTEAAGTADVDVPVGCLHGACATCTAELLAGTVEHVREPRGLKNRHREDGYVLACIATPTSDCRLRVGGGVKDELVENPWR